MKFFLVLSFLLSHSAHAALDPVLEAIDQRLPESEALTQAANSKLGKRRALAATAYGRIMSPAGISPLLKLSSDALPFVREASAFALGQLGWLPESSGGREVEIQARLVSLLQDKQLPVRLAATEALGKIGAEKAGELLLPALQSKESPVRAAAVMALFRARMILKLRTPEKPPGELSDALRARILALAEDKDGRVRLSVAYFLARNSEPKLEAAAGKLAGERDHNLRMFALMGLAKMKAKASRAILLQASLDKEYTVRTAAVGALIAGGEPLAEFGDLVSDPSFHVRAAFAAGLKASDANELALLEKLHADASATVRAEAMKALAKNKGAALSSFLAGEIKSADWLVREAAVQASEPLTAEDREKLLLPACADANINVRAAALEAVGTIPSDSAFRQLRESLASSELAIRGTAVAALKDRKESSAQELVWKTYGESLGGQWTEMREDIAETIGKDASDAGTSRLKEMLQDPARSVRAKARKLLLARGQTNLPEFPEPPLSFSPYRELTFRKNPLVEIVTNKGTFLIECFAKDAPIHVADFVGHVKDGFYNGLSWHRVVSNFVIQGGDPDGSGWGGSGYSLRAEINEQRFLRGALGMPRSQGFDTGGGQLFFSHIPTPHLDGQYTVFGRIATGADVVDRIERGDKIISARVVQGK